MNYIFVIVGMLLLARPITLYLRIINCQSIQKKLGLIFKPVPIKGKFVKFFWGKWTRDFFECDEIHEISFIVLLLLPFNILTYVFILAYLVIVVIAEVSNNEILLSFAYEKYGLNVVTYMVILGIFTMVFLHWAKIWKSPKVSIKEQKAAVRNLNKILKDVKNQEWYYPLWEKLMNIACLSNDEMGEYWFEKSQIPKIKELTNHSSKKAILNLEYKNDQPCKFTVLDSTNKNIVFQGLFKK